MKQNRYSEFANYIVMAGNSKMSTGYEAFLRYKEVVPFLHQIATKIEDTFLYEGTIYKKKITSSEARNLLDGFLLFSSEVIKPSVIARLGLLRQPKDPK